MTKTLLAIVLILGSACVSRAQRIEVTVPSTMPLNGHLILVIAKSDNPEPRMQLSETYDSAQGFGVDAENFAPGTPLIIDATTFGYPRRSLADLEAGDYYMQAVFNVYEQVHLASGRTRRKRFTSIQKPRQRSNSHSTRSFRQLRTHLAILW